MTQTVTPFVIESLAETPAQVWPKSNNAVTCNGITRLEMQRTHKAPALAVAGRACVGLGAMLLLAVGGLWLALDLLDAVNQNGLLAVGLSLVIVVAHVPLVLLTRGPRVSVEVHQHLHVHGTDGAGLVRRVQP